MTALDRLYLEQVPDGTFGGARPQPKPRPELIVTTPDDQIRHARELAEALCGWTYTDDPKHHARHLAAVPTQPDTATTRTRKAA